MRRRPILAAMDEDYERRVLEHRDRRAKRTAGPDGWLTVVGLFWLEAGENAVGSDTHSRVRLPADKTPSRVGTLEVSNGNVRFQSNPDADVRLLDERVKDVEMLDDLSGPPTVLSIGPVSFFVIRRYGRLGVRVKDSETPERKAFRGFEYYPSDPKWRIEARFEPYDPPATYRVPTVLGIDEDYLGPGALRLEMEGSTFRIDPFLEPGEDDLFIVFGDLTNGAETYEGGRYVYAEPADERGVVVVDFNMCFNPPCVLTPHATCALVLPQNRLPIRVEAGEKLYRP
jgi:uncharacterized protein (DUF1684 family)